MGFAVDMLVMGSYLRLLVEAVCLRMRGEFTKNSISSLISQFSHSGSVFV